ncbi:DUF2950 domain-containing protein [Pseudaminobacter arsenicus]|uniref:DUF2950 domain-containing protein n=2 Tax=Borborobacter arsenicus TaxID=1851146 RepID=A0A432V0N7_9HYPH|nr:DUF2950 domain-containing protein [Pseudaminobacter arsenicus]RUM95774.1 DUF2950 domain-containing protein [Pseudaminobacter arsenicus]
MTLHRGVAGLVVALILPAAVVSAQEKADISPGEPIGISSYAATDQPPAFDSSEAAIDAFKAALAADDVNALARLLGLDAGKLKADENTISVYAQIREAATKQFKVQDFEDRKLLNLGPKLWPFPFPLVKGDDGKWAFDTAAGLEEIVNRRIGENELQAIATLREYVDAQREYAAQDRDGDGVLEYAQKLVSSEGKTDGLYWPAGPDEDDSPAGGFADQAALDKAKQGEGYFGYRFRILTRQGDNVAGGSYDYVINGNMIGGFALLAWPVTYEETGVSTFLVNHNGTVYQADLGPSTEATVKYIESFNPDEAWSVVND